MCAFPVDVWIKRGMQNLYFSGEKVSNKVISSFAQEKFGNLAGYAQEFLFHYLRTENLFAKTKRKKTKK